LTYKVAVKNKLIFSEVAMY